MSAETWTSYAYRCDGNVGEIGTCAALSPISERSFADASSKAEADGWWIGYDHRLDLCPAHRPALPRAE